ncbi:unnamed protein product [Adineta ricciae]|uniref:RBR-type E3 ubiquitin transferase n=1 Tax=Adineta ricciae TaxID=249248 RepID=A0A813WYQ9_ADIRI|nr:unnamed protein product [Adineta ricciae]
MRRHVSPMTILTNEQTIYYLLSEKDILKEIKKIIRDVIEILGLQSTTLVRLLLSHFHWDQDLLTDRYWDDPDRLFRITKLPNPDSSPIDLTPASPAPSGGSDPNLVTCKTCYSEKPPNEFYSLACNHKHCLTCWQLYLQSCLANITNVKKISCPSNCNQIVDDDEVLRLLKDDERLAKLYEQVMINSYVDTNRLAKWCPGNSCSTLVRINSHLTDCTQMISCDVCKTTFCFHCLQQWHDPIQCSLLVKWEKKNRDESMTSEWLIANTKECPNCHASIEKNGGCNHMTCRKPGCAHEFCWICFGPWKDHATRQCNVFREDSVNGNQLSARENLARYMHYFTRYQAHNQSLELETNHSNQVEQRIQEMQAESKSFTEQQATYKAFDVLQQCRRTLKYTYAFAYYLYRNNQAEVFEQNQADLERATEALSGFLESEIDAEKNVSTQLMDKTRYCDQRRKILIDHCKEGYAEHYWGGLDAY